MKKILFLLLLSVASYGQTSTGQEQEFDYGIKNNSTQTITTPTYLGTFGTDGTQGKIPSAYIEKTDNKQNSLAVDGTGAKYPTVDAVVNALDIKSGNYFPIPFIEKFKDPTKNANILIIGDSNYANPDRMVYPFLRNILKFKNTNGIGFFSFSNNAESIGINAPTYTGTWVDRTIFSNGFGVDGKSIYSNTLTSTISITPDNVTIQNIGNINEFKILYRKNAACTLEIATDGVTYTDYVLSTSPGGELGVVTVPLTLSSTWLLRVRLKVGEVELLGAIASNTSSNGIKVHKAASSGAATTDFSSLSNSILWKQNVELINPDIILIGLSTNDVNQGIAINTIKTNLTNIYNNIRVLNKNCAIYFVIPPKNDDAIIPVTATTYANNSKMINELSLSLGTGVIPIFDVWSKFDDSYTDTLFADGIHYNATGAYINSELLSRGLSLSNFNGVVGIGQSDFIPKFKFGILTDSNIFNDGVKIGFGTASPTTEFSFKNQITINDGVLAWGNTGATGFLSWDTGKAIVRAGEGRSLNFGSDNTGDRLVLNTDGSLKITTTPTTSSGTYDILTRNSSTGIVEKVASNSLPLSGTYIPTFTNTTNITSSTLNQATYTRIGNIISVTIGLLIDVTTTGTTSKLTLTLPTNTTDTTQTGVGVGNMTTTGAALNASGIVNVVSASTAEFVFYPAGNGSAQCSIQYQYNLN